MPVIAKSIESGIAVATISAARQLPSRPMRIAITRIAPSRRFFSTVRMVEFTRSVRLYIVSTSMPAGSFAWSSSMRSCTRPETSRLFSPISMRAEPSTASAPSCVAEPVRTPEPMPTSATSLTRSVPARAPGEPDRQIADFLGRLHAADGTHRDGLAAFLHHGAAGVGDVLGDDVGHLPTVRPTLVSFAGFGMITICLS
jgi:hypothetical protein